MLFGQPPNQPRDPTPAEYAAFADEYVRRRSRIMDHASTKLDTSWKYWDSRQRVNTAACLLCRAAGAFLFGYCDLCALALSAVRDLAFNGARSDWPGEAHMLNMLTANWMRIFDDDLSA